MTLKPNSVVRELIVDTNTGAAKGVRVVNQLTKQEREEYAKVVVLCASTLESTRILMNSKSRQHPNGFGNSSDALGRYLMDHMYSISAGGIVPQLFGSEYDFSDGRANGIYVPRFRNITDKNPNFIRGYGMQGGVRVSTSFFKGREIPGFGGDFKKMVREAKNEVTWGLGAWCEMLPRADNRVTIDPNKKDAWGIPVLHVECTHGENEKAIAKDALETILEMADAAKFITQYRSSTPAPPGFCIHEVGTARMGSDRKTSVLNEWNQTWDAKNVFVTDGAAYASIGCQNPTLTMMAITARACDHIVDEMKRGNL